MGFPAAAGKLRQRTVHGTQKAADGTKRGLKAVAETTVRVRKQLRQRILPKEQGGVDNILDESSEPSTSRSGGDPANLSDDLDNNVFELDSTTNSSSHSSSTAGGAIVVGPTLEFLTADTTLFWIFCFVVALYSTIQNWSSLLVGSTDSSVPFSVVGPWLMVAYATGQVAGQWTGSTHHGMDRLRRKQQQQGLRFSTEIAVLEERHQEMVEDKKQKHTLLMSLVGSRAKIKFSDSAIDQESAQLLKKRTWTTLKRKQRTTSTSGAAELLPWQINMDPSEADVPNKQLVQNLLKHVHVRRINSGVGAFDLTAADSLEDTVQPLFELRGMDVFLTDDDPESDVGTHPWLISQGLREVPTFTVNILTQWGNILIYFAMPSWVSGRLEDLNETEDDTDDIKAVKVCASLRFLVAIFHAILASNILCGLTLLPSHNCRHSVF